VWTIKGAEARPAGLFAGGGRSVVAVDGAVTDGTVVAVTVERDGGADAPTTDPVVASPPV
jgi:anti-sigma-K factor RskA